MSLTHQQIAADLAPRLDGLIDAFLINTKPKSRRALEQFLWDNKVGILRVLQEHAHEQRSSPSKEG